MTSEGKPWATRRHFTCEKCGRSEVVSQGQIDKIEWWLIGTRTDDGKTPVIRCPEHISIWSLRLAGLGRGKDIMAWWDEAREKGK